MNLTASSNPVEIWCDGNFPYRNGDLHNYGDVYFTHRHNQRSINYITHIGIKGHQNIPFSVFIATKIMFWYDPTIHVPNVQYDASLPYIVESSGYNAVDLSPQSYMLHPQYQVILTPPSYPQPPAVFPPVNRQNSTGPYDGIPDDGYGSYPANAMAYYYRDPIPTGNSTGQIQSAVGDRQSGRASVQRRNASHGKVGPESIGRARAARIRSRNRRFDGIDARTSAGYVQ
jgi:hypothetical protein